MPGKGKLLLTGQLGDVMQESAQAFTSEERAMINHVLDLQTLTVRQAMRPLEQAVALTSHMPVSTALASCRERKLTRLPVWDERDGAPRIVGMLALNTLLYNPALDVMKAIPSVWDETIVLPGSDIGKCAAFARRSGKQWFIGVINGGEATTLDLPLDFLGRGKFQMIQLGDAPDRTDAWQREEKVVTRKDQMHLSLRPGGGCVIELTPQK